MTDAPIRSGPAPADDNRPPEGVDPFVATLEERHAALLRQQSDLELAVRKLPQEVTSDEDVALINAHVLARRNLAREVEATRVDVKAPYLSRERVIDAWFGGIKTALEGRAKAIEQRSAPYLHAKRQREQAEADARAAKLRQDAREAQERADAALAAQRKAEQDRLAEEQRQRDLETERARQQQEQERIAREAQTASETPAPAPAPAEPLVSAAEQEEAHRKSIAAQQEAQKKAEDAAEEARKLNLAASRADTQAARGGGLGRTQGGGASAKANMVWVGRIDSFPKVIQSMGPLGPFLNETILRDAVAKAARANPRPEVPGVVYSQELEVKTTQTRAGGA